MTHDELLYKIEASRRQELSYALRAVVELHKLEPHLDENVIPKEVTVCGECVPGRISTKSYVLYPCKTIQAIERELG